MDRRRRGLIPFEPRLICSWGPFTPGPIWSWDDWSWVHLILGRLILDSFAPWPNYPWGHLTLGYICSWATFDPGDHLLKGNICSWGTFDPDTCTSWRLHFNQKTLLTIVAQHAETIWLMLSHFCKSNNSKTRRDTEKLCFLAQPWRTALRVRGCVTLKLKLRRQLLHQRPNSPIQGISLAKIKGYSWIVSPKPQVFSPV